MKSFTYVIRDPIGIHARPAGMLAKEAKEFQSVITLICNGKSSDVRKLMGVMSMGIRQGDEITLQVDGPDEGVAITTMKKFFEENL